MKNDKPHRISDNESIGNQADPSKIEIKKRRIKKIIISIGFDENLKEFKLWDYLYDVKSETFELEATPDYKNRIQYYEITADSRSIREFRLWLIKNEFKYKIDI
jgi:hypothetical protein